jgi:PAS domain S-box-containing protein
LCYTAFNPQHKKIMKILYGAGISIGGQKLAYVKGSPDARWIKAELVKALQGNQFTSSHYQKHSRYEGYIQCTYNPIRNEKNEIKGVAVFIQDVTDRIRFEEIIKSINANLRAVMESTTDGILALDRNLRYITFNQAHAKSIKALYGKDIRTGDRLADVLPPELFAIAKEGHQRALKGKPFTLETKIEKQIVYETSYNPIHDDHGQITGTALFIRDITSRKQLEEQLKALNAELANQT